MIKTVILDSDEFSRKCIVSVLEAAGLNEHCRVQAEVDEDSSIHLCVGALPDTEVYIRENDRFLQPFRVGALLDRVRKHQEQGSASEFISIGPYTLNIVSSVLIEEEGGKEIRLTEKEKHILTYLSENAPQITDRDSLLGEVWGYVETVETHTLETHIYRLRQKIEKDPAEPKILLTDEQGYRLA